MKMNVIVLGWPTEQRRSIDLPAGQIGGITAAQELAQAFALHATMTARLIAYSPLGRRDAVRTALEASSVSSRVEVMDHHVIRSTLGPNDPVVIQLLGAQFWKGMHLRWLCGSPRWPVIVVNHALSDWQTYSDLRMAATGPLMPYDTFACTSTGACDVVQALFAKFEQEGMKTRPGFSVIPLGVDLARFSARPRPTCREELGLPLDRAVFLYLGRIEPRYKADLLPLLQSFARVQCDPPPMLVVAGATLAETVLAPLKMRAAELGIHPRVRWFPDISSTQRLQLLSAADVFVSPVDSFQESFGLSLLEAMACGLPVIASDWSGYRDIVDHANTGILVPTWLVDPITSISQVAPLDTLYASHWEFAQSTIVEVGALAAAMTRLAEDGALRRAMGAAGQARVKERYAWPRVVQAYERLWAQSAELAQQAAAPPAHSPYWYDHGEVFSSYATMRLTTASVVQAISHLDTRSSLSIPPPFLSRANLARLMELLVEPIAIAELPGDAQDNLRHVAHLVKLGLAAVVQLKPSH